MSAELSPALTVIVALERQRERCELALGRILAQSVSSSLEVLLIDAGHDIFPPLTEADHPSVRVIPISRTVGYGEALARGALEARAPIIAFLEEHVQAFPGWAEAIIAAHQGPWAAVGCELYPSNLERLTPRVIELVSRHDWSAPARRGETNLLRWQNVTYKRATLMRYADRLPLFLQSEGALFRQLKADGERLFIEPDAKAIHAHESSWREFLVGSFYSNRLAIGSMVKLSRGSRIRKLASALAGPIRWPLVLLRRTRSLPDREVWERRFWAYLPFVLQYYATVSAGTLVGLCFGVGNTGRQFLNMEINPERTAAAPPAKRDMPPRNSGS